MEREQIIKDFEEVVDNYSGSWKRFSILNNACSLIKELTEENERLREKADRNLNNLKAVLEERSENAIVTNTVRKMKALIVKESTWFVTKSNGIVTSRTYQLTEDKLEQIAKELLEGTK